MLPEPVEFNEWIGRCPFTGARVGFYGNDAVGAIGPTCELMGKCPRYYHCPVHVFVEYCGKAPTKEQTLTLEREAKRLGKDPWDLWEFVEKMCER